MTDTRPGMFTVIIGAYSDVARVLSVLWAPALMALSLFVAAQFLALVCAKTMAHTYLGKMLLKEAIELIGLALIAPFLIAVHRFILLGETKQTYEFIADWPRVRAFIGWLVLVGCVAATPMLIAIMDRATRATGVVYYVGSPPLDPEPLIPARLATFLVIAIFMAVSRLMILLPALAVDARGANLKNLFADTRHRIHYIAGAMFFCMVPFTIALALLTVVVQALGIKPPWTVGYLIFVITLFCAITLATIVISRVYLALGDRLNQPARG